jgi:predicted methyltransferase
MNKKQIPLLSCLAASMIIVACSNEESAEVFSAPMPDGAAAETIASDSLEDSVDEALELLQQMNEATAADSVSTAERVQSGYLSIGRPAGDAAEHGRRKPDQVLSWAGIEEGMSVIDLSSAGGYYAESLAWAVGFEGWVVAQNTSDMLDFRDGSNRTAQTARLENNRLPQIETAEMDYSALRDNFEDMDAATLVNNLHDIYNGQGEEAAIFLAQSVFDILTPGGFWIVIDHLGTAENNNADLHRIEPSLVRDLLEEVGFEIVDETDILSVSADDPSIAIFNAAVRGRTHRFILKAMKPAS